MSTQQGTHKGKEFLIKTAAAEPELEVDGGAVEIVCDSDAESFSSPERRVSFGNITSSVYTQEEASSLCRPQKRQTLI